MRKRKTCKTRVIIVLLSAAAGIVALIHVVDMRQLAAREFKMFLADSGAVAETMPAAPSPKPAGMEAACQYTVRPGDTLKTIADRYKLDVPTLLSANPQVCDPVQPGDMLLILPAKGIVYTVADGDTLSVIADVYGVSAGRILAANNKSGAAVHVGEKLFLPDARAPLRAGMSASRSAVSARMVWPVRGQITSPFGSRWGRLHAGVDIANNSGTPIRAAMAGRVSYAGWYGGYGYAVILEHGQGYSTLYGHLSSYAVGVGQYVQTGQAIACMGSTGYSTGPHLHFEVRDQRGPFNPLSVLP